MTDPVSDMLIRIKNGSAVGRVVVSVPYSKLKEAIGGVLVKHGYLESISRRPKKVGASLEMSLAYPGGRPKLKGVKRLSKPSKRVYMGVKDLRPIREGYGLMILSTPKGLLSDKEAKKELVGGEALFSIW